MLLEGRVEGPGMEGRPGLLGVAGGRAFSSEEGLEDWESMSGGGLQAAAPGGLLVTSPWPTASPWWQRLGVVVEGCK